MGAIIKNQANTNPFKHLAIFSKSIHIILKNLYLSAIETSWLLFNTNGINSLKLPTFSSLLIDHPLKICSSYTRLIILGFYRNIRRT